MSIGEAERDAERYSLGRTLEEHERLRAQARMWETATVRVLDEVGVAAGTSCLDAGCGPGETMRLLAERAGPTGRVLGIDVDAPLGAAAVARLHREGHRGCSFAAHDLTGPAPVPGAPFGVVYARLLLFHLPQRAEVLARLWDAVAPGGHLVLQDYDLEAAGVLPALASVSEVRRVLVEAFGAAGCDVRAGTRLPRLFSDAGVGDPDGTDVAGRLEPLRTGRRLLDDTLASILPVALAHGITTERDAAETRAALERDAARFGDRPFHWPLLVGAWKRKLRR